MIRRRVYAALSILLAVLGLTSCRWDIWGSEPIDYGQGLKEPSALAPFTGSKPASISASKASDTGKITVTWEKVPRADYYIIERAEVESLTDIRPEDIKWQRLLAQPAQTVYIDRLNDGLDPSMKYLYRVRGMSYISRDRLGQFSDPTAGWLLSSPMSFSATQGEYKEKIRLSWNAVNGIAGYRIEWRVDKDSWEPCASGLIPATDEKFDFEPPENLSGRNISFRIQAVSTDQKDSTASPWSSPVIGYTKSVGAPEMPKDFRVSKAESQTDIVLSWVAPSDKELQWEIYRKSARDPERRIFSSLEDGVIPEINGEGRMVYSDSERLRPGVEYTYSVRALKQNKEDKSWISGTPTNPRDGKGFLFSPPTKVKDVAIISEGAERGFSFTFEGALGETADWSYIVYGRENDSAPWTLIEAYSHIPADPAAGEYRVTIPYDGEADRYEQFAVKSFNGSIETDVSSYDATGKFIGVPRPQKPGGFNASDNMVYDFENTQVDTIGQDKVYRMAVTFETQKDIVSYNVKITRANGEETVVEDIVPENLDSTGEMKIIRNLCSTGVGEKVLVSIQGVDTLGRKGDWSEPNDGYSAITDETLIKYMQIFCLKPWEFMDHPLEKGYRAEYVDSGKWSYQGTESGADLPKKWQASAIRGKISQNGTGSLSGGITEYSNAFAGHPAGSITYVATVQGLGGRVSFNYSKFGEVPFMTTDGFFVMVVSMSGSGSCDGGINVKGWYPASVGFDGISVSNQKFVGMFSVKQENGTKGSPVSPDVK